MERYMLSKLYQKDKYHAKFLFELLGKFTRQLQKKEKHKIYNMIINKNSDEEIIDFIGSVRPINIVKTYDTSKRAVRISNILCRFLPENLGIKTYLDIGCNNGQITISFGNRLGLNSSNIYGIDVETFSQQKIVPLSGFMYMNYDGLNIPFDSNSFDLVSCFMVLHHVEQLDKLLNEINRIIKPGGYFLIKEHNVFSECINWLVYIEHMMYDVLEYGIKYEQFVKTYFQYTYDKNSLAKKIENHGFRLIEISSSKFIRQHHKNNPTKNYYALYQKNNDDVNI